MTEHASVVKNVHKVLRNKFKTGLSEDAIWSEHMQDEKILQEYSASMHSLASLTWKKDKNNRIEWCKGVIKNYYKEGGLKKSLRKELKTQYFQKLKEKGVIETKDLQEMANTEVDKFLNNFQVDCCLDKKLLLDVGSCFNPFDTDNNDYYTIAIDIAPATENVIFCDFLNLKIEYDNDCSDEDLESIKTNLKQGNISGCLFDIVVFSLLLSYFPSSKQRLQCCLNAYQCLSMNGLFLLITPDSSHQNKHVAMMKSWKNALESIGFVRFKYEKLDHLHCMAYRKSKEIEISPELFEKLKDSFFIPQDSQEMEDQLINSDTASSCAEYDNDIFAEIDL